MLLRFDDKKIFFLVVERRGRKKRKAIEEIKTTKKKPSFFKTDKAKKGKNIFGGNFFTKKSLRIFIKQLTKE